MNAPAPGPLMIDLAGPELTPEERDMLAHPAVGGLILFTRNYRDRAQLAALCAQAREARPGLLIAADYEGGRVQRFRDGFTLLPPMRALGELYDRDPAAARTAAGDCGLVMAAELGAAGLDMPLAPVLDLDRGVSSVIGDRAFHADPAAVTVLARALRRGLNAGGMVATGKHFPGHGGVAPDSHLELPVDERGPDELASDLAPFRDLIADGLESVMMAHLVYPAVDDRPASLSRRWIGERLRGDLGFDGAVFCDDLSMAGAAAAGDYPDRAAAALEAGCDILPVCNNRDAAVRLLDSLGETIGDADSVRRRRALARRRARVPAAEAQAARVRIAAMPAGANQP
ncbi:beta-hexosaminidase [Salinisphaera sp. PC39]|uniref:beta-N-acetylhexosaminidase n=1 Tax=Salinisphaera sp. PC39 TaxID=1304156 RepID=UPI00334004A2